MLVLVNCSIGDAETDIDNNGDSDNGETDSDDRENEIAKDEDNESEQGKCYDHTKRSYQIVFTIS